MSYAKIVRRCFYKALWVALRVVWPVFSVLIGGMLCLGVIVSYFEGWPALDGVYFAFVTGLTVGYGDLVPRHIVSRIMAICIGFTGVLLTALFAAISVRALQEAVDETASRHSQADGLVGREQG